MIEINYASYKKPTDYVKLDSGDNVVVIVSRGYFRKLHGMKTARSYIPLGECIGVGCPHCAKGMEAKNKYTWMVLLPDNKEVKVWDAGPQVGDQICSIARDKGIDPNGYKFMVNKSGIGLKTQYAVSLLGKYQLNDKENELIGYAKVYLTKKYFTDSQSKGQLE